MPGLQIKKELSFNELFLRFINDNKRGRRLQPNGKRISAGTVKNYEYTLQLVQRFCTDRNFSLRIRPARKLNRRELVTEKNYWKKFYKRFTDYLYDDCGFYDNYAGQHIKNLKVFFNYLNKELLPGAGDFHKQFYVRKEEIPIFPLMPEELSFLIYNKEFEASLKPRMKEVKDFFVFGCTVALRFSDLVTLKKSNIRVINGQHYLTVRSIKTDTDTLVKLPPYAVEIINRYSKLKNRLLPVFNKVNLNKFIKQLLELAGFKHPVMVTRGKRGKRYELKKLLGETKQALRFCDVATTHTMRRTAITTMLSLGVPEPVVRKISGHAPGSKEFYRYVFWAQTYQDMETEKMFSKLQEKKLDHIVA
jgi:integrase